MKSLSSNQVLYEFLVKCAGQFRSRGLTQLADSVTIASRHAAGMSTEFLGESRIALRRVLHENNGSLTPQERSDISDVVKQLDQALMPRPLEKLYVGNLKFIMEQDGPSERELKSKLAAFFESAAWVRAAYLARVTYEDGGPMHVALCVGGQPGQNRVFAERVGQIFASIFGRNEHLDTIWLTPGQEASLAKVCRPFFEEK